MTAKEAIKILEMFLHKQCDLERTKFAYNENQVGQAVKMASEALEKQIPKNVMLVKDYVVAIRKDGKRIYKYHYECPSCRGIVDRDESFCTICGQAIDWGKEKE